MIPLLFASTIAFFSYDVSPTLWSDGRALFALSAEEGLAQIAPSRRQERIGIDVPPGAVYRRTSQWEWVLSIDNGSSTLLARRTNSGKPWQNVPLIGVAADMPEVGGECLYVSVRGGWNRGTSGMPSLTLLEVGGNRVSRSWSIKEPWSAGYGTAFLTQAGDLMYVRGAKPPVRLLTKSSLDRYDTDVLPVLASVEGLFLCGSTSRSKPALLVDHRSRVQRLKYGSLSPRLSHWTNDGAWFVGRLAERWYCVRRSGGHEKSLKIADIRPGKAFMIANDKLACVLRTDGPDRSTQMDVIRLVEGRLVSRSKFLPFLPGRPETIALLGDRLYFVRYGRSQIESIALP